MLDSTAVAQPRALQVSEADGRQRLQRSHTRNLPRADARDQVCDALLSLTMQLRCSRGSTI